MFTNKHKNSWAFFCQGTTSHLNCLEFHSINFAVEHVMTISSNKIILISKFSRKLSYHTNSRQFLQSPVLKPIKDPQNTFKMLKCDPNNAMIGVFMVRKILFVTLMVRHFKKIEKHWPKLSRKGQSVVH